MKLEFRGIYVNFKSCPLIATYADGSETRLVAVTRKVHDPDDPSADVWIGSVPGADQLMRDFLSGKEPTDAKDTEA